MYTSALLITIFACCVCNCNLLNCYFKEEEGYTFLMASSCNLEYSSRLTGGLHL